MLLNRKFVPGVVAVIGVAGGATAAPAGSWIERDVSTVTLRSTILYFNNGNWSEHATNPSAILFPDAVTEAEAQTICASNDETLIDEDDLELFLLPLQYQTYLSSVSPDQSFWTSSGASGTTSNNSLPFICTNTAPLVDAVETEFSLFPKVYVESNDTTFMGVRDHMTYRFLGVPYVLQPVGDLRLAYPIQWYTNETGTVLNATTYGPTCPTSGGYFAGNAYGLNPWGNSEACLLLNIFTPYLPGCEDAPVESLKPVMVWMHGGGGTATDATFDGASLTSRSDVVLVSLNIRGGNFGGLSFDDGYVDGNYGVADFVAGLQWVHDHIKAFGGNPNNVTVFGQSAGGESVMNMVRSPKANGLLTGAILMSAAVGPAVTQEQVVNATVPAVQAVCGDAVGAQRLSCLRSLSVEEFMSNISWKVGSNYDNVDSGAIIDGIWIANNDIAAAKNGELNFIHFMSGSMPDEGQSLLGSVLFPNATDFNTSLWSLAGTQYPLDWPPLVESSGEWNNGSFPINAYNATIEAFTTIHLTCPGQQVIKSAYEYDAFKSYWYYNNLRAYALSFYDPFDLCTFPVGKPETPYYKCHSGDLYEVFGTYYIFDQPIRVPEDIGHTNLQQDTWGAFARTGDPNPSPEYLQARGYNDTASIFASFQWPAFEGNKSMNLDFPTPYASGLPWAAKCSVVEELFYLP